MLKALFLDIDGVILSGEDLWRTKNNRYLPPEKIDLVHSICDRTGAAVVVSSTWRCFQDCPDLLAAAGLAHRLHRDWRTDQETRSASGIYRGEARGRQIQRWLDSHPEVSAYAIVDDDSDMLPEQMPHFVKTAFTTGLDGPLADRLVGILNSPPPPNPPTGDQ
jgi:hypothetical protein